MKYMSPQAKGRKGKTRRFEQVSGYMVVPKLEDGFDVIAEFARYDLSQYPIFAGRYGATVYRQQFKYETLTIPCTIIYKVPPPKGGSKLK